MKIMKNNCIHLFSFKNLYKWLVLLNCLILLIDLYYIYYICYSGRGRASGRRPKALYIRDRPKPRPYIFGYKPAEAQAEAGDFRASVHH